MRRVVIVLASILVVALLGYGGWWVYGIVRARAALTRARGFYYQALYGHTVARFSLQRAMGILGPQPGVVRVPAVPPSRPGVIEPFAITPSPVPDNAPGPKPIFAPQNTQGATP